MQLPSIYEFNEFNRILSVIRDLTVNQGTCLLKSVLNTCSSIVLGGRQADHFKNITICCNVGLLKMAKQELAMTDLGIKFLELNEHHHYEINDPQKKFIIFELIFNGVWKSKARDLFLNFIPNYKKLSYELTLNEKFLEKRYHNTIHVFKNLGIVYKENGKLFVIPIYVPNVRDLIATPKGLSEAQLDSMLKNEIRLSKLAENAIVVFEKKRLLNLGRNAEADLVRRISQLNVSAGYDIESFNGDFLSVIFDRFIEVKASIYNELKFFWTINEYEVAKEKGDNYWIYFVGGFNDKSQSNVKPILIQNPAEKLYEISQIKIEPTKFMISQIQNLPIEEITSDGLKWYILKSNFN